MKKGYCLSCHAPEAYVFMVPLRASAAWLKKVLCRRDLINGTPLRKAQVDILRRRVTQPVEVGWYSKLEYFLEAYEMGKEPNQALQATAGKRPGWHVGRQRPAVPELGR